MAPILAVIAILIKLTSRGSIFFIQERVGLGGKTFRMYKFRSMVTNAEELKAKLATQNEMDGPTFKMKNDPRGTGIGKFLRKTSLDEFPQLLNVLAGDMSLVGPRPPLMSEVKLYKTWQTRRLSIKPGITCTWQISGRNEIKFEDWMRMDLRYLSQAGCLEDLRILVGTFFAVISRRGAC
jgi:lipopolysaccharide/colanic/teichoic acid biosynthesis glycosyltransferase